MEIDKILKKIDKRFEKPLWEHNLVYDSPTETLEPVYFWILDFSQKFLKVEKLIDNFTASPGSGWFAELGQRRSIMQKQGMEILATINTIIKSIINLIYDLKDFEIRLEHYDAAKSSDEKKREAGLLALKQIWMDNVDIKRGRGSINMLTAELGFSTLRDAFMVAKSVKDVDRLDINERTKRILKPRVAEFFAWKERSERELRKRFEIEKIYLKSQVNSLKLYTRWVKPYLKAAEQLTMREMNNPALVTAFNTMILELLLMGTSEINVKDAVYNRMLPHAFLTRASKARKIYSVVFIHFMFRGIPRKIEAQPHYVHGGKVEVNFRAYALNEDQLNKFKRELDANDFKEALKFIEGATEESLKELQEDLEHFIGEEEKQKEQEEKLEGPITVIINTLKKILGKKPAKEKKAKEKIKPESYIEKRIRELAEENAKSICFRIYDVYKKSHAMPSFPQYEE